MKNPKLGEYLLWRGKPAKVIGLCDLPTVMIEMLEDDFCECGKCQGKKQMDIVIGCPNWNEGAEIIPSITK